MFEQSNVAQNFPSKASTVHDWEFPDVQVWFGKRRGTRDQIANIFWIIKNKENYRKKKSTSALLTTLKPLTLWITKNCGKSLKKWGYMTTLLASWKPVCGSRSNG